MLETINYFLYNFVNEIKISDKISEKIEKRYQSLGEWLNRNESNILKYEPEFYAQGSVRLGTAIKPLENVEYDLDAVCVLKKLTINDIAQSGLKKIVGEELHKYHKANNFSKPLTEGKRCWTFEYSDSERFHFDLLPAIYDKEGFECELANNHLSCSEIQDLHAEHAIAITDNTLRTYNQMSKNWNKSNPKGYYEWFKQRCNLKKSYRYVVVTESIEDIPDEIKDIILQQVIMILKRHRDIMFTNDLEDKPISIIITTLAAYAYDGEENLYTALLYIVDNLLNVMTCDENKNCIVKNPVNPSENFADKWIKHPKKKDNFFKWIEQLKKDIRFFEDIHSNKLLLEDTFGQKSIHLAYNRSFNVITKIKVLAKNLLSLPHVKKPYWKVENKYKVKVNCQKSKNGMQTIKLKSGENIDKNWHLRFSLQTDCKLNGRKFYWQVTNSGKEAEISNALRGDFYEGEISKGGKVKKEDSLYIGAHFVRCFVVVGDECVGVSEPFIVNIV